MNITTTRLTSSDCVEIYCALRDHPLMEKIGSDGELLASGSVTLTEEEIQACIDAVESKRDAVLQGDYDWHAGEIGETNSESAEWAEHLSRILETLQAMERPCSRPTLKG